MIDAWYEGAPSVRNVRLVRKKMELLLYGEMTQRVKSCHLTLSLFCAPGPTGNGVVFAINLVFKGIGMVSDRLPYTFSPFNRNFYSKAL